MKRWVKFFEKFSSKPRNMTKGITMGRLFKAILTGTTLLLSIQLYAEPRIVSVTGHASLEVPADQVLIRFSVINYKIIDINKAKAHVDDTANKIIGELYSLGIKETDITTDGFQLEHEPSYENDCKTEAIPAVGRSFELTLRDLDKYNSAINALVNSGVTDIRSSTTELSDKGALENRAMALAIADAKAQATFLADNLGAKIGKPHKIGHRRANSTNYLEEVLVSGLRRSTNKYEHLHFKPAPIEISAQIYVEFELQ